MGNILFVTPFYAPFLSGARAFLEASGRRMVADGHSVNVLTTTAQNATDFWRPPDPARPRLPHRETLHGVSIERVSLGYPWPAPYTFGLLRRASHMLHWTRLPASIQRSLLRSLGRWMPSLPGLDDTLARLVPSADLVHVVDGSWDGLFTAAAASAQRHRKHLVVMPFMHLGDGRVASRFQMAHQVDAYRASDAVVALSCREATALAELGVPPDRIHVLRMGVDPGWQDQSGDPAGFRQRYGLSDPVIAFLGAHTYDKGVFTLVQAVARLNRQGIRVQLACAGPQSEQLIRFAQDQSQQVRATVRDQVKVLGEVSEQLKHELLAACDVLALPSRVDAFGIVLAEAGLHAKPVIGADAGGIPEVIEQGVTGLLVPFDDVCALADAIRGVVTDPRLAARLGDAGHHRVLSRYTWDHTYRSLKEIYLDIL